MGCALKMLNKNSEEQKTQIEKRFLILGLDGAGKTSILNRLVKKDTIETEPTIGLNIEQITHKNYLVTFWDLGGAAAVLWKHYYNSTDAIIFVVDSTDRDRIDLAREELVGAASDPELAECPLLVLGNKKDKEGAMALDDLNIMLEFDKIPTKQKFLELCSAKENQGIFEGLEKVVDVLIKKSPGS